MSGAALLPAVTHYGGEPLRRGARLQVVIGPEVPTRPGRDGLVAMTQEVADVDYIVTDTISEASPGRSADQSKLPGVPALEPT